MKDVHRHDIYLSARRDNFCDTNPRSSPYDVFCQGSVALHDLIIDDGLRNEVAFQREDVSPQRVSLEMAQPTSVQHQRSAAGRALCPD